MASTDNQETPQWARQLSEQFSELQLRIDNIAASTTPVPTSERLETPVISVFCGTGFKSTGFASSKKLDPYGDSQDADNPKFDPKARET
ncbi:hypothetical protein E4U60_007783, partial [Claviceps pazoutovae]